MVPALYQYDEALGLIPAQLERKGEREERGEGGRKQGREKRRKRADRLSHHQRQADVNFILKRKSLHTE